jgi:hypothetical protein
MPSTPTKTQQHLVHRMLNGASIVAKIRREELARCAVATHLEAVWDLSQLAGMLPADPKRAHTSGLLEMQRLFGLLHSRGHG